VVEDQPDNRQIIRDMLGGTDYEIKEAEDGEQALGAVAKQHCHAFTLVPYCPIKDLLPVAESGPAFHAGFGAVAGRSPDIVFRTVARVIRNSRFAYNRPRSPL
jgi:CheY-like chemotaxis protein